MEEIVLVAVIEIHECKPGFSCCWSLISGLYLIFSLLGMCSGLNSRLGSLSLLMCFSLYISSLMSINAWLEI